jgi:hypothetical protein
VSALRNQAARPGPRPSPRPAGRSKRALAARAPRRLGALALLLLWFLPSWRAGLHHSLVEHGHGADGRCWHWNERPSSDCGHGAAESRSIRAHGHAHAVEHDAPGPDRGSERSQARGSSVACGTPSGSLGELREAADAHGGCSAEPRGSLPPVERSAPPRDPRWSSAEDALLAVSCSIPWSSLPGGDPLPKAAPAASALPSRSAPTVAAPRPPERRGEPLYRLAPKGSPPALVSAVSLRFQSDGTRPGRA